MNGPDILDVVNTVTYAVEKGQLSAADRGYISRKLGDLTRFLVDDTIEYVGVKDRKKENK